MNALRVAFAVSMICLFVACGGSDDGGKGGAGGAAAGTSGSAGAGGGGAAGTTGTGGSGQADCAACIACVTASCSTAVSQCQADTACNALYECGRACTFTFRDCANMNLLAALTFSSTVASCITMSCQTPCANSI